MILPLYLLLIFIFWQVLQNLARRRAGEVGPVCEQVLHQGRWHGRVHDRLVRLHDQSRCGEVESRVQLDGCLQAEWWVKVFAGFLETQKKGDFPGDRRPGSFEYQINLISKTRPLFPKVMSKNDLHSIVMPPFRVFEILLNY